ncbi:TlpA family protein disulfide reductase [Arenibacter sp. 6A1]|uniref:TlpA family protein disulfide reductase n=1 Tax=Arenibacter sp. 6A1 TaxID=2720391 RepID=UPI001448990B|nr:TlpA disulfide reductase family protein [Arenibacter sp. 6A1]NKI27661.1 TlpA family protein disulfide reductase [Arenibacter sp. 6A1]
MSLKNQIVIIILVFGLFLGCKNKPQNDYSFNKEGDIEINLNSTLDEEIQFESLNYSDFPVYSLSTRYPKLYNNTKANIPGIPKLDSFQVVSRTLQWGGHSFELYKSGYLSLGEFLERSEYLLADTLALEKPSVYYGINAISGFIGDKQVVLIDANSNGDFSDDVPIEFNKDFRYSHEGFPDLIDVPIVNFNYRIYLNNKHFDIDRKIQLYPHVNHPHAYLVQNGTLDNLTNEYTLMLHLKDYRKGRFSINNVTYTVGLQGIYNNDLSIVIKPDTIVYEKDDLEFQRNFTFRATDTIEFPDGLYKLDGVSTGLNTLYLKKLPDVPDSFFGHRIGTTVADYEIKLLDQKNVKLYNILGKDKKFTLLDFWGTWCAPCKELTPELKRIHNKYSENLNFLSIALDTDVNEVKEYVKKNKMDWHHAFVDRSNRNGSIVMGMRIQSYPTLVLLDENNKVIFRGGSSSLNEIDEILSSNQVLAK